MMLQGRPSRPEPPTAILIFFGGCAAIYLGCRGFQVRGIGIWDRTGGETRVRGWPGRILGGILIAVGMCFIWAGTLIGLQE